MIYPYGFPGLTLNARQSFTLYATAGAQRLPAGSIVTVIAVDEYATLLVVSPERSPYVIFEKIDTWLRVDWQHFFEILSP